MEKKDAKRLSEAFNALRKSAAEFNESLAEFEKLLRSFNDLKLYDCVAFIMTHVNKEINASNSQAGYANGYVAVQPEHPYFGKDYDDIDVDVHGGVTFAEDSDTVKKCWDNLSDDMELLDGATEIPSGWYIFGFDTMHFGDSLETCPKEYCVEETIKLKKQLDYTFV